MSKPAAKRGSDSGVTDELLRLEVIQDDDHGFVVLRLETVDRDLYVPMDPATAGRIGSEIVRTAAAVSNSRLRRPSADC